MDEPIVVRRPIGPPPFALRLAAVLAVPLLLYALVATGQKALENYRLNQEADALRAELVSLRAQNIELQQQIEQARTDSAIEALAREQLGLIKPGDHAVLLVSQSDNAAAGSTQAAAAAGSSRPVAAGSATQATPAGGPTQAQSAGGSTQATPAGGSAQAAAAGGSNQAAATGSSSTAQNRPTWRQWWDYFFG
jgi:cell division protein FtsB